MTARHPDAASSETYPVTAAERRRVIAAASAGNFVEWYAAGVYGIVAVALSKQLFPGNSNPTLALINTYAIFAISYLLRPLGGVVFGHIADRLSRKRALSITIMTTCVATGLIGVIPTYRLIGWFAPIILLVLRLVQSMGTGGETPSATSFVYEHARPGKKATAVGQAQSLTFVGLLVGALASTIMSAAMPGSAYHTYGWRILFLLAIPMGLVGWYVRRRTEEGAEFRALQQARAAEPTSTIPLVESIRRHWARITVFIFYLGSWAVIGTLLTNYLPTFLDSNKSLSQTESNAANLLGSFMVVVLTLAYCRFADRVGLRRAMIISCVVLIIGIVPGFALAGHGLVTGFLGAAIIGICKGTLAVPAILSMSQLFPVDIRVTSGGLAYNLSSSLLGGTSPVIAVWLNHASGTSLLFSSYIIFFGLVTLGITLVQVRKWVAESAAQSGDAGARSAAEGATGSVAVSGAL